MLLRDIDKVLKEKKCLDLAILLLEDYQDFLDIFSRRESDKLLLYRLYNYNILLKPGIEPPA